MESNQGLSQKRIHRLKVQGYSDYSDHEISALAFGNRFAFILCSIVLAFGVGLANIPILVALTIIAFGGIVLPYHPFDYIYNHGLRHLLDKPKLPPRSAQLKFTCTIATLWLGSTIALFYSGLLLAAYIFGTLLFLVALTVSTTDFCIPSTVYNFLFQFKVR